MTQSFTSGETLSSPLGHTSRLAQCPRPCIATPPTARRMHGCRLSNAWALAIAGPAMMLRMFATLKSHGSTPIFVVWSCLLANLD